jgi:small subunit ribosomal protein S1
VEPVADAAAPAKADLGSLSAMLKSHWKEGPSAAASSKNEPARAGQIRSYRITKLDAAAKKIELEQA